MAGPFLQVPGSSQGGTPRKSIFGDVVLPFGRIVESLNWDQHARVAVYVIRSRFHQLVRVIVQILILMV